MATLLLIVGLCLAFTLLNLSVKSWLLLSTGIWFLVSLFGFGWDLINILLFIVHAAVTVLLYFAPGLRKRFLSRPLYGKIKQMMPPISATEQAAIDAGTVWWDAQLFSGNPDWQQLFSLPPHVLTEEEQAFIDGPVETVCAMTEDWQVTHELEDLPKAVWDYIADNRFFALNADKAYGGLGFSAYAQSCIVQKLATRSGALAVTVMVPNSLGPAELLYHYGTEAQKEQYLPRLNSGEEIPCFGLTNPWAGSDAGGMPDFGIVTEKVVDGNKVLGFEVTWEKRYITLGPVATLLGLAFKAYDPDGLLGDEEDLGITCALVPTDTPGVNIGDRHNPLNASFQNGPNSGEKVFIPFDWVIGGRERIGQGWRMLMESLAAGRGISLPAASAGGAKFATRMSASYSRVREQFGYPIGKFEGVAEVLARMGGYTYLLEAGRKLVLGSIDKGDNPAVMSAIAKQQCTDLSRQVINDAMDVHGGKGICMGPNNYLGRLYQQIPIGITVEGANILTRSLIIFGQGSMRCHPYLLDEIKAVTHEDEAQGRQDFDLALKQHIPHVIGNKLRSFSLGLSRGRLSNVSEPAPVKRYMQQINHLSASFAYLADVSLLMLGGALKRKEMLSGRFADAMSYLYLSSAAIRMYKQNGSDTEEAPLLDWACQYALYQTQEALRGVLTNYPVKYLGCALWFSIFPTGRYLKQPSDRTSAAVAALLQQDSATRERLSEHLYLSDKEGEITAALESAFLLSIKTEALRKRLRQEKLAPNYDQTYDQWVRELMDSSIITEEECLQLLHYRKLVRSVIDVDAFEVNNR